MKNHTKVYLTALGYDITDFIPSELTGDKAVDIHHIDSRGMGGDPTGEKDRIENLMALTREEHDRYGDNREWMTYLYGKHRKFLYDNGVKYDNKYFESKIKRYDS